MMLSAEGEFGLLNYLLVALGVSHHTAASVAVYLVALLAVVTLVWCGVRVYRRVRNPETYLVPDNRTTLVALFDSGVEALLKLMEDVMGPAAQRHLPLIGTIFFYILVSNVIGLIPGMTPATSDLNTNFAIAASVFVYYNYMGIRAHGFGPYMKHFMGPMIWIAPLFFVIELVSHAVRPLSLSIRLFGNMTADHAVLGVFTSLVPIGVPVIFLGLGLFVCVVQAFVFTLLSIVYIALAEAHMDEAH